MDQLLETSDWTSHGEYGPKRNLAKATTLNKKNRRVQCIQELHDQLQGLGKSCASLILSLRYID